MHLVDALARMQLTASGQPASSVPIVYQGQRMTLLKGPDMDMDMDMAWIGRSVEVGACDTLFGGPSSDFPLTSPSTHYAGREIGAIVSH